MRILFCSILMLSIGVGLVSAKTHMVSFGKWTTIRWASDPAEDNTIEAKVRPVYVDGQLKEFTVGLPHEITDRLIAVRRALRVNDALPREIVTLRWIWQPGGWLLIDRVSGRITQVDLTDFDPYTSLASWYRDYVAYCGVSDDGRKLEAIVLQSGKHKPVLKKKIGDASSDSQPLCSAPDWQRQPMRVSFDLKSGDKATYSVRGRAADAVKEAAKDKDEEDDDTD